MDTEEDKRLLETIHDFFEQYISIADVRVHTHGSSTSNSLLEIVKSQKVVPLNQKIKYSQFFLYDNENSAVQRLDLPATASKAYDFESGTSELGYGLKTYKENKKTYLDVWKRSKLLKTIEITELFEFIYNDNCFGTFKWNRKGNKAIFTAERKEPKAVTFYEVYSKPEDNLKAYETQHDKFPGYSNPTDHRFDTQLFVFDAERLELSDYTEALDELNLDVLQASFDSNDDILFVGLERRNFKESLVYCFNRPKSLYRINRQGESKEKVDKRSKRDLSYLSVKSANVKNITADKLYTIAEYTLSADDGYILIAGCREEFFEHNTCFEVLKLDYKRYKQDGEVEIEVLIDRVRENSGIFNGYYKSFGPSGDYNRVYCMKDNENQYLVFSSIVNGRTGLFYIHLDQPNQVRHHPIDNGIDNFFVYTVDESNNRLLIDRSGVKKIKELLVVKGITSEHTLLEKVEPEGFDGIVQDMLHTYIDSEVKNVWLDNGAHGAFVTPKQGAESSDKRPLIVALHGGPFSYYSMNKIFAFSHMYYLHCGYNILYINYRGSTGYGLNSLESLRNNASKVDVDDCIGIIDQTIKEHGRYIDENRIAVYGGSHGGFLTAWLAGHPKFCNRVRTAIAINAVIYGPAVLTGSNIPEWAYGTFPSPAQKMEWPVSTEALVKFYEASPIRNVKNVKCPVLVINGEDDRTVSEHNGRYFYHCLKKYRDDCKIITYKGENHQINGKEPSIHEIFLIIRWLKKWLK